MTAELVVLEGDSVGRRIPLRDGLCLGPRGADVPVAEGSLGAGPIVFAASGGGFRVKLPKGAGATLNGAPVQEAALGHGDLLRVGATALMFSEEEAVPAPARPGPARRGPAQPASPPVPGVQARRPAYADEISVVDTLRPSADRDTRRLVTLYRVGHAIGNVRQLAPLLDRLIEIVLTELPADRGIVYLLDEESRALRPVATRVREGAQAPPGGFSRTILREAIQKGEAILTADAAQDPRFRAEMSVAAGHIVSALCAPVLCKGKLLGALALDTVREIQAFSEDDLDLLSALAAQAAVAIENAQVLEREKRTQLRLRLLNRATTALAAHLDRVRIAQALVEHAAGLVGCRRVSLLIPEGEGLRILAARGLPDDAPQGLLPGRGTLSWHVMEKGETLCLDDARAQAPPGTQPNAGPEYMSGACLLVPLRTEGGALASPHGTGVLGVLCLSDKMRGKRFSEEDRRFLDLLAAHAATMLANASLFERATVETLTRLDTRSYFFVKAEEAFERARADGSPVSLLLLDLDHFKKVNDTLGHAAGDEVLREAGDAIRSVLRPAERGGRYGGEEILVLLPGTDAPALRERAEGVRRAFSSRAFKPFGAPGKVTASIGAGVWVPGETAHDFVRRVDAALYKAKQGGRNRLEVAT
ncbi:MAG: diguanylate cyclase [Planctomycetes bacterium]|nr:diguanylate cyclase [Planctomycetota bacterium]